MFFDWGSYAYYIRPGFTDMRCGCEALARIVVSDMGLDVHSRSMFLFLSKSRRTLAVLVWDRNGFWLMRKRLSAGTFPWPKDGKDAIPFTVDDICRLLEGNDVFRRLPTLPGGMLL